MSELAARCDFPPPGTAVAVAVSGGADSLALLVLAAVAGLEVTAVHVDHGLRAGSADEAATVAGVASRFGARFEARRAHVDPGGPGAEAGGGPEARARRARYAALPPGVLTGHTADDLAETVLLNLCWGAGIDGLSPLLGRPANLRQPANPRQPADPPREVPQPRRPLLGLRRAETHRLCEQLGLTPVCDPDNDDLRFRRNRVRHQLLPLLADVAGRDPVPVLVRQARLLDDDARFLASLADAIEPTDAAAVAAAPLPLARRAIRAWLRAGADAEAHPPSAAEVARVLDVAAGGAVACEVSGGRRVARSAGRLSVSGGTGPDRSAPIDAG